MFFYYPRVKRELHPKTRAVTVISSRGERFQILMVLAKSDTVQLNLDRYNHPAWTGRRADRAAADQVRKFEKRYSGIRF